MPKFIPNLKEKILFAGKTVLTREGYKNFTIRAVAKSCNIGIGTIYNYFESKDILIASIMLADWNILIDTAKNNAGKAKSALEASSYIYSSVEHFTNEYSSVWKQYILVAHATSLVTEWHDKLVHELADILGGLMPGDRELLEFICDNILRYATSGSHSFKEIERFFDKLLS